MKGTYFISGIDTNIGKSIITGILARELRKQGKNVITQKMVQTGNEGFSEDIEIHRKIMNIDFLDVDKDMTTAPEIFSYPCSPHLAAKIDKREIDLNKIKDATQKLESLYEIVLLEGAGGLMVPLTDDYLSIDYICDNNIPLIFVTSGKLGSLNHTLLNLKIIKDYGINLYKVVYNLYPKTDSIIEEDSLLFIKNYLKKEFPETLFEVIDEINI